MLPGLIYLAIFPSLLVNLLFSLYLIILFLAFLCIILFPSIDSTLPLQRRHISCLNLPWAILSPKYLFTAKTFLFVTLCCCIREGRDSPHPTSANADIYARAFLLLSLPVGRTRYFCQPVSDTYLARQWSSPWRCTSHSPGWKSTLQFWIRTSVLSDTHGMRWAGLSKLCLGNSIVTLLPACHMNPSKALSPEGLGSYSCPLPDNSGTMSCRRTESMTRFAVNFWECPQT